MDGHTDKVWALDVAPLGNTMISGGADSQILTWNDTTRVTDEAKRAEREESYLMDQKLANHLRHKEFAQALDIALTMDRPRLTLRVFTSIIETELKQNRDPKKCLQQYISGWSIERVAQVLQCCRDWNTRARNCDVAMIVIRAIVSVLPAEDLGTNDSVGSILAGVTPYAERHFDRLEGLISNAYLLDFALFSMGSLSAPAEDDFSKWEFQSKLVLPPAHVDGKIQVGGQAIVGSRARVLDESDVSVIGESDSSDDESDTGINTGINRQEKDDHLVPDVDDESSSSEQSPARGPAKASSDSSDSDDGSDGE
jgi:Utp13 specific WD40 associated domain